MDSRFPTYYLQDRRVLKASPTAFRLFVIGSAWSVSNMTDGLIPTDDFPLIPLAQAHDADTLVSLGLWSKVDAGWRITDFLKIQTSAAVMEAALENRRQADRDRQAKARAKKKAKDADVDTNTNTSRERHVTSEGRGKEEAEAEARTMNSPVEQTFDPNTGEVLEGINPWTYQAPKDEKTNPAPHSEDPISEFMRQAGAS